MRCSSQNPVQLLERVKALQNDLPRVQEDWQRVMVAKQTIIDIARSQQMASHRVLKQLNTAACLQVSARMFVGLVMSEVCFTSLKSSKE